MDPKALRESHPDVCAKYTRFVEQDIRDQVEDHLIELDPLRGWQAGLVEAPKVPPSPREFFSVLIRKAALVNPGLPNIISRSMGNPSV